jgi:hypothetical protein
MEDWGCAGEANRGGGMLAGIRGRREEQCESLGHGNLFLPDGPKTITHETLQNPSALVQYISVMEPMPGG